MPIELDFHSYSHAGAVRPAPKHFDGKHFFLANSHAGIVASLAASFAWSATSATNEAEKARQEVDVMARDRWKLEKDFNEQSKEQAAPHVAPRRN